MMDEMNRVPLDQVHALQLKEDAEAAKVKAAEAKLAEAGQTLKDEFHAHDAWERALRAKQMRDDQRESIGIVQGRHADLARLVTRRR